MSLDGEQERNFVDLNSQGLEHHLRREVEDGNVSWHDFERTRQFASSSRSFFALTLATGTLTSGWGVYYGRWYRRPPWSWPVTLMLTPISFIAGMIPGIYYQSIRVKRFQEGLEDRRGLSKALGRFLHHRHAGDNKAEDVENHVLDTTNDKPDMGKQSRWVEIRNATLPAADSTWDKIRQSYESGGTATSSERSQDAAPLSDREAEQAKFDAMLEAERKISS